MPKTNQELQNGEEDFDMCFKALPLRKRRRKGKSPRKIPKVTDRTTELQVALAPKFINCPGALLGEEELKQNNSRF